MKQFLFFLFSLISGIVVFFLIIGEVGWQDITESLALFPIWKMAIIFILGFLIIIAISYKWRLILKNQKTQIPIKILWKIVISSFLISYLTPIVFFANEVLVVHLIKKNNIATNKAIAFVLIEKIIAMTVVSFLIVVGLLSFIFLTTRLLNLTILISAAIIFFLTILAFFYWRFYNKKSVLTKFLKVFKLKNFRNGKAIDIEKEIFAFFTFKNNKIISKIFGITFLIHILIFIQYWLLVFFLIQRALNILEIFSLYAFTQLAHFIPFPAALGGLELSSKLVFDVLGLEPSVAIAFSLILRGAMLLISLIGTICLVNLLLGLLKAKINNNSNSLNHK